VDLSDGSSLALSPDGTRLAVFGKLNGNVDVWLVELSRGAFNRFTLDPADEIFPVWSPDGTHVAFSSNRKTRIQDLYRKSIAAADVEELLLETAQPKFATDWSPDGRFLLYFSADPKTGFDIWALALEGDRKPFPIVQTSSEERLAQFSPDGKWIAYESNESGRFEVYLRRFAGAAGDAGAKIPVSANGGSQVRWRRDGKELFYIGLDGRLMKVPLRFGPNGRDVEPGVAMPLFPTRLGGAFQPFPRQEYVVSSDGRRFLMNAFKEEATSPLIVILNWHPQL